MKEYILSFTSGFFSFISPCVLPLIPGYLSLISGLGAKEIRDGNFEKNSLLFYSFSFVIGFSIVFTLLGIFSSIAGSFLIKNRTLFQNISGIFLFIIGLHISGVINISFLNFEKRSIYKTSKVSLFSSFFTGVSFAFGWSPCIGPFLASILTIAASKSIFKAGVMLFIYSVGFGIPFIIAGLFSQKIFSFINKNRRFFYYLEKIGGILMSIIGILIFFDKFSLE